MKLGTRGKWFCFVNAVLYVLVWHSVCVSVSESMHTSLQLCSHPLSKTHLVFKGSNYKAKLTYTTQILKSFDVKLLSLTHGSNMLFEFHPALLCKLVAMHK